MSQPVFLSYSHADRPIVARLASDLRALGVTVWWDKWELKVGDSLTSKIQDGIHGAAYLCIVLSPSSVRSAWVKRELTAGLVRELEDKRVFVLPLLAEHCDIPLFLRDKLYADFTDSYEEGFATLLERVAPRLDPELCASLSSADDEAVERAARQISLTHLSNYTNWLASRLMSQVGSERRSAIVALQILRPKGLLGYLTLTAKDVE
ncbi:MAG: hypothetical protein JWM03_1679, partial [Rhodocyclales bacterium]|nr:hypothetical protein [Rhodocyclales bacterium]